MKHVTYAFMLHSPKTLSEWWLLLETGDSNIFFKDHSHSGLPILILMEQPPPPPHYKTRVGWGWMVYLHMIYHSVCPVSDKMDQTNNTISPVTAQWSVCQIFCLANVGERLHYYLHPKTYITHSPSKLIDITRFQGHDNIGC